MEYYALSAVQRLHVPKDESTLHNLYTDTGMNIKTFENSDSRRSIRDD